MEDEHAAKQHHKETHAPPHTTTSVNPANAQDKAEEYLKDLKDFFKGWNHADYIQGGILIVGVAYCVVTFCMWHSMERANQIAQDAIRISQRPWVGFADDDPTIGLQTSPIQFNPQGDAIISWQIILKDFGSTAAQDAWANAQLMVTNDLPSILAEEKYACDNVLKPTGKGGTLLPGRSRYRVATGSMWPHNKIDVTTEQEIWLVGCIGYLDQGGHPYHYGFSDWLKDNASNQVVSVRPRPLLSIEGRFVPQHESID